MYKMVMMAFAVLFLIQPLMALDIENAKRINRTCALCHGVYGQGTPGTLSPRLAGLPKEYIAKELRYYRDGVREYAPMVLSSSIKSMTEKDIEDISDYLAGINLRNLNLPKIPEYKNGNHEKGKEVFMDECKTCHRKTGLGRESKGVPPLAGQYGSYLFRQMRKFREGERYHADDPDDETFTGRWDSDLDNLIAFLTKLPPHGPLKNSEPFSAESMTGMISMAKNGAPTNAQSVVGNGSAAKIAGRFHVTPEGDIILKPTNQDMRSVAGLSGNFKVTSEGLVFIPK